MLACSVCTHGNRTTIEGRIRGGASLRGVARMFDLSKDSIFRHKKHMANGSNGATATGHAVYDDNPVRRDAAFERDYWTLVACFAPGVPQLNGKLQLAETVRAWSPEKKNKVFQEALSRGDLVLSRRGDTQYVERPESRHVARQ